MSLSIYVSSMFHIIKPLNYMENLATFTVHTDSWTSCKLGSDIQITNGVPFGRIEGIRRF